MSHQISFDDFRDVTIEHVISGTKTKSFSLKVFPFENKIGFVVKAKFANQDDGEFYYSTLVQAIHKYNSIE